MDKIASKYQNKWSDREVEQHWDDVAEIYVEENNKVKEAHDQRFKESIKHMNLEPDSLVLNISSRDCEANDFITNNCRDCKVINAEISSGLMQVAKNLRPHVKQVKIDTYSKLPFKNEHFNRILCLETLEHASNPIEFLRELNRVSDKSARMVLSCPPATSEIPYQIFTKIFGGHGEGPHKFPSSKSVKKMFELTGWKMIMHKGAVLMPVGPKWIQDFGEKIIRQLQNTFVSELGIRQFFVCEKY